MVLLYINKGNLSRKISVKTLVGKYVLSFANIQNISFRHKILRGYFLDDNSFA